MDATSAAAARNAERAPASIEGDQAETVEARVLDGVRTKLLAPDAIRQAVAAIGEAMVAEQRAIEVERAPLEQEPAQIERKLQRAQRMCLEEAISTAELKAPSVPLKQRQNETEWRLALATRAHVRPRPIVVAAASAYAALAENLHLALAEAGAEAIGDQVRELIERVDFIPLDGLGRLTFGSTGSWACSWSYSRMRRLDVVDLWVRGQDLNL